MADHSHAPSDVPVLIDMSQESDAKCDERFSAVWEDDEVWRAALRAIVREMPDGQARFRTVEPTGMGRNDYHSTTSLAAIALHALRALPIDQRMSAMGMEPVGLAHQGCPLSCVHYGEAERA